MTARPVLIAWLLTLAGAAGARDLGLCEKTGQREGCLANPPAVTGAPVGLAAGGALVGRADCPADWAKARRGDCLARTKAFGTGETAAYVHPAGWVVDPRCFEDSRFTAAELVAALTTARRKMDPKLPVAKGGCLSRFNPEWGGELAASVWTAAMHVACPPFDAASSTCADRDYRDYQGLNMLTLRNVSRCMGPDSTGLAGVLFHETLHAAGADNFSTAKHNTAWNLPQYEFVRDEVYGAEALCFYGLHDATRGLVNYLQCTHAVERGGRDRGSLCQGYSASFSDMPAGFFKH